MMNYKFLFLFLCTFVFANEYVNIELSDSKKNLSKEIFKKLEKEHYLKKINKDNFNERYIKAILEKLDKNKTYFTKEEVEFFLSRSMQNDSDYFDIELAYNLINLYYKKLIDFSDYQIYLLDKFEFDFSKEEYLDIFYEDNQWISSDKNLKELWRLQTKNDLLVANMSDSASSNPHEDLKK